jgi:1-acyl-sn-glycerol-3-phosphate acyltransferase
LLLFAAVLPLHLLSKLLLGRSRWPSWFLGTIAWLLGARVSVAGRRPGPHTLIVANHLSWFDILILGGSLKSAFVAKDELGLGFLHWLADQNATIYVSRSNRREAKDQAVTIARALEGEQPVAVFPEGTTGPGTHLLPFRSTLLEAAHIAANRVEVRPVAIDYGDARGEIAWFEERGKDNVMRLLRRRGTINVTVHLLDPLDGRLDRKTLAAQAQEAIGATLGFKSPPHSPIAARE